MLLSLVPFFVLSGLALAKIKQVVFFGDSFTDQSRSHSISNGTVIGKDYEEIYPPTDTAADGGFQWPFYLGLYGSFKIWNYAVGGAACNNYNTPETVPDVRFGQTAWFVQDHITNYGSSHQKLDLDPDETAVILWVGTNDVGIYQFITSDERKNVSFPDLVDCQFDTVNMLYELGVRKFIINSMIPLHLTRLYRDDPAPIIYWPWVHNGTVWAQNAYNFPRTMNRMISDRVKVVQSEWDAKQSKGSKGGSIEYFDTYSFFEELYDNPTKYYNGSLPANVTGHCHQCPNATDWHYCNIGDCTPDQRDSFMWWDELHPSEQTGRNLAAEMLKKLLGTSKY